MDPSRRTRVGVLVGGETAEREVSVRTGEAVLEILRERRYDAVPIHVDRDLDLLLRQERIERAFVALHGRGADGAVQGLLETLGIPYTGPSLAAAALASDKLKAKELLRLHNLPTPAYYRHRRGAGTAVEQHHAFGFPCVVKPRVGVSGLGVARVDDEPELKAAVEVALRFDDDVLVERYVAGMEVQVALLDGRVLGMAEMASGGAIIDFAAKYTAGRVQVIVPPRLGAERLRGILAQSVRAYHLFGCEGAARVDVLVSEQGNESVLEVETLPDLAAGSLVAKLAHAGGLSYGDLVEEILVGARLHTGRRARERRTQVRLTDDALIGDVSEPH